MGVRRFACKECGSKYATKAKLYEHMEVHSKTSNSKKEAKKLHCEVCLITFSSAAQLKRHQKTCKTSENSKVVVKQEPHSDEQILPNNTDVSTSESLQTMTSKMQTLLNSLERLDSSVTSQSVTETVADNQTECSLNIRNMTLAMKNSMKPSTSKTKNVPKKNSQRGRPRTSKVNEPLNSATTHTNTESSGSNNTSLEEGTEQATPVESISEGVSVTSDSEVADRSNVGVSKRKIKAPVRKGSSPAQKRSKKDNSSSLNESEENVDSPDETEQNSIENTSEQSAQIDNASKENAHPAGETSKKSFTCAKCSKTFTRKFHLDRHLKITPCSGLPPRVFECQVCNRVYSRKDNLREHLRVHTGESQRVKKHKCNFCNKAFHGQSLLTIHIRTHTGEKPFLCDCCTKRFPSSGALSKHMLTHTGEKAYECPECGHRFSLKGTLKRHIAVHTGVRPYKCMHCDKQFIQIGGLKAHMFYHTGENGFQCDECDKVFNRKARLQMHKLYVHAKHKPFACKHCPKCFTRKEDLYRHAVLHTGEKPFKCPSCPKTFAIKSSLKLHLLTHTKEEPRSCHECGRAFIRKDCLIRHMRKRHRDLLDKIILHEKDEKYNDVNSATAQMLKEEDLCENITELLSLLVEESTLVGFGWPNKPVDEVLEAVIRRCGHMPVCSDEYSFVDRMRENAKLLFTVVIDDSAVKTLLNNQTVDEVILHVLRLAKT